MFHSKNTYNHDTYVPYLIRMRIYKKYLKLPTHWWLPGQPKTDTWKKKCPYSCVCFIVVVYALEKTVSIKVGDLDFDRNLIILRVTKKYKQRLVPFGKDLAEIIYRYCIGWEY